MTMRKIAGTASLYYDDVANTVNDLMPDGTMEVVRINGAVPVTQTDAGTAVITAVSGTTQSRIMLPVANASFNSANAREFYSDATGVKTFQAIPGIAIDATAKALIIAFSTTVADTANISALLTAATTAIGTPNGAAMTGVIVLTPQTNLSTIQWPKYDGTNRIKSIGMSYVGALASGWVELLTVG